MQKDLFGATSGADFSEDRRYRYKWWRIWDPSLEPVCFCMCNPSDADEQILDPTVTRVRDFTASFGHGGLYVVNLFGLVSSDPKALIGATDPVGTRNDAAIAEVTGRMRTFVAWGNVGGKYKERVRQVMSLLPSTLWCLRITKAGHPEHPLYLPRDLQPVRFDIQPVRRVNR